MEMPQICATDKEIFDVLMSRKKNMTETVLHELTHDRRIFCSTELNRHDLCDYLSRLPYDYNDLSIVVERAEAAAGRGERSTFVTLDGEIDPAQIRQAIEEYSAVGPLDKVSIPMQANKGLTARIDYTEFDFSKTRLAQRRPKEATLIFSVEGGKTTIRLPANDKARSIVDGIRAKLESVRTTPVSMEELSLARLDTAELRTSFFTGLIRAIPKHKLQTVVGLKVASFDGGDEDDDEGGIAIEKPEILTVVTRASLAGENLIATPQFRSLQEAGFFICAIRWQSMAEEEPRELIQFDVSLENPVSGTGLKYMVRHAPGGSALPTYFKRLEDIRERNLLTVVQSTARKVISSLAPVEPSAGGDDE